MTRKITSLLMTISALVWIAWDVFVAGNDVVGDTESEVILDWSIEYRALPFVFGVLGGHWFWPRPEAKQYRPALYWSLFAATFLIFTIMLVLPEMARIVLPHPLLAVLVGIPIGHYMWPQFRDLKGRPRDDREA